MEFKEKCKNLFPNSLSIIIKNGLKKNLIRNFIRGLSENLPNSPVKGLTQFSSS
jgi:hypothetical protein